MYAEMSDILHERIIGECLIENCEFAESKAAAQNSQPAEGPSPNSAAGDGFMNIPSGIDEELPFN